MFSKKATKIDEIFNVDLTVTTYCHIDVEYFVNFCGLLRKRELHIRYRYRGISKKSVKKLDVLYELTHRVQNYSSYLHEKFEVRIHKTFVIFFRHTTTIL